MTPLELAGLLLYGATVGVALAAPIGPINVEIVRRGLRDGFANGWLLGLGAASADTVYAVVIVMGVAQIADSPMLRLVLYIAGAIAFVYLGLGSIRDAMREQAVNVAAPARRGKAYLTGFIMAAANPMGIVYWLTVGSGLAADAVERVGRQGAPGMVAGVTIGILAWVTSLSVVAHVSRRFVTGVAMRWITGLSGIMLLGFALYFGWQVVTLALARFA